MTNHSLNEPEFDREPVQVRKNLIAFLVDVIFYWLAAAFTDPLTVLVTLMAKLGASPSLLGLSIALRFVGQYGVQVFVAYFMQGKQRQKKFLVCAVGLARLPMLILPYLIMHAGDSPQARTTALWATIVILSLVGLGEGLAGVPWAIMLARAFSNKLRGRFLTGAQIAAGVLTILISTFFVRSILPDETVTKEAANIASFHGFSILILLSAIMFQISTVGLMMIQEPDIPLSCPNSPRIPSLREYVSLLPKKLKQDKTFAKLVKVQFFLSAGWAAYPYYAPYALHKFKLADNWAGTFQLLQALSIALLMPVWNFLMEKRNEADAVKGVSLICLLTPIYALLFGHLNAYYFGVVFLMTGGTLASGGMWLVINHFVLTHSSEEERPMLVALLSLLNLPAAIFPLAGSLLIQDKVFLEYRGVPVLLVLMTIVIGIGFVKSLQLKPEEVR